MKVTCHSLHWNNVDKVIISSQRQVFNHFNIDLIQHNDHGKEHGIWMEEVINDSNEEIIVFADIDAFPLNLEAFKEGIIKAENGIIYGLAQHSNLSVKNDMYAGPMFLFLKKDLYEKLGAPSLSPKGNFDAAEIISVKARELDVPIELIYPSTCLKPKWALKDKTVFGIGTFYENKFFHLFESRNKTSVRLFKTIADDIIRGNSFDFSEYLKIVNHESKITRLKNLLRHIKNRL